MKITYAVRLTSNKNHNKRTMPAIHSVIFSLNSYMSVLAHLNKLHILTSNYFFNILLWCEVSETQQEMNGYGKILFIRYVILKLLPIVQIKNTNKLEYKFCMMYFFNFYLYNDDKDHLESMHDIILLHMVGRKINEIITSILTDYSLTMFFVSLASFYKLFFFYATIKVN